MNVINLRRYQLKKLKPLELGIDVLNSESYMLVLNKKYRTKDGSRILFKYLDAQDDEEVMNRKITTLERLNASDVYSSMEELIIPDTMINVEGNIAGFGMPLIEDNINLGTLLNSKFVTLEGKKHYLKKLGDLLDRLQRTKDEYFKMNLCDLNEYNFIVDSNDRLRVVDLDSSYTTGTDPSDMAYYLLRNKYLDHVPNKYKKTESGIVIPSDNTDLYCYNMIILNTLANHPVYRSDVSEYYEYLDYLKSLGVPKELIYSFFHIYTEKDNINPREYVEGIPINIEGKSDYKVFQKIKQ